MLSIARPDNEYYDLLDRSAGNAVLAAQQLRDMIADYPEGADLAREILLREQQGDSLTHEIIRRLNTRSRSPFAASRMHELATALDDIVDLTEQVADSFGLYGVEAPMEPAHDLAEVLSASCVQVAVAVQGLRTGENLSDTLIEIHRLENEGDRVSREAIASLFAGGIDPMVVIRWKDIFEQLEQAIDACEHVAHTVESISLLG